MSVKKSVLLQRKLPRELEEALRREGIDPHKAWLCAETDLNLAGQYERVYLLVFDEQLLTVAQPSAAHPRAIRIQMRRDEIEEIRTRQGVGGGFLDARGAEGYAEVLAYSNAAGDTFNKAAEKLKRWRNAEPVMVTPEDDINPRKCPECGMTLLFSGDVCRRCVDRGAIFARVLKLMRPYAGKSIFMMVLVLAGIALGLAPNMLVGTLIDKAINPVLKGQIPFSVGQWRLLGLAGAILGVRLFSAVIGAISGRLSSFIGTQISYDMRARVFNHLTRLSVSYYDRHSVGQLMNRVGGDTEQFRGFIAQLTSGFLAQFITLIVLAVLLFTLNWKLAFWTLLPTPLVVLSSMFFWKRIYPRYYRVWDAGSKLHGTLNTILSGIRVVKAFGQEKHEQRRFNSSSSYICDSSRSVEYTVAAFNPVVGLVFQLGSVIVWFLGGQEVMEKTIELGALIAFIGYTNMFYQPLTHLTQLTSWLTGFLTAAQRTFEILDTTPQVSPPAKPKLLTSTEGTISFRNVYFGYNRYEPIIKGVSFDIAPGEHIGVVGKSGSGKTTLVNLIARFYDVNDGSVSLDGVDVRHMDTEELRRSVGVVLQEPFLFRGTIYSNIAYGRHDVSTEDVIAAAKAANAHEFIMRQPLGYDTYIGERGAGLSGGERQRVSIARALLYDPRILILDEATSSVDTESERAIQQALARVTAGRTTIAIAHRLSTLKNSDRIFVVDLGRIIESGSHEELMARGGLYYRLVKIQTELSRENSVDQLHQT